MIDHRTAGRGHWLLDLEVAGRVWRIADSPLTVERANGEELRYQEGLADLQLGELVEGAAEQRVQVAVDIDEDWGDIEADGHLLVEGRATLRRWWEGVEFERARVQIRGLVQSAEYGAVGEGLVLEVVRDPRRESDVIPPAGALVSAETWPVRGGYALPAHLVGTCYPIVIGTPGRTPDTLPTATVPALLVEYQAATAASRLLLCLGRAKLPGDGEVWLGRASGPAAGLSGTVGYTTDLLGRTVTYAEFAAGPTVLADDEDQYYVGYGTQPNGTDYGGGLINPFGVGEALRGAGDVIAWALSSHSSMRVDRAMMLAQKSALNAYKVDTYINRPINTWDWLEAAVLRWVPAVVREGPEGLYAELRRWDYRRHEAVAHLSADRHQIQRASPVSRDALSGVANEITVRYAPLRESGKWGGQITLTARPGRLSGPELEVVSEDTRIEASGLAAASQRRFGVRPKVLEIPQTCDRATAVLVAGAQLEQYAWPRRHIAYDAEPEYEALRPGQPIRLVDSELGIDDKGAIVDDAVVGPAGVRLLLTLQDGPA